MLAMELPQQTGSAAAYTVAGTASRRQRSYVAPTLVRVDDNITPLLDTAKRHSGSPAVVNSALASLAELTSWQSHNQQGVVDTNGLCTLFALLKRGADRRAAGQKSGVADTEEQAETVRLVLWVLMNLAANEVISPRIAAEPDCIKQLVSLLDWERGLVSDAACRQCAVFAGRCLVNLTRSSAVAQDAAIKAGALKQAARVLMRESEDGIVKVCTWLLSTLASSHHSPARAWVAGAPDLLKRLLQLLDCNKASSVPTAILAAKALSGVARGGAQCQSALAQAGVTTRLLACLDSAAAADVQLEAAAMEALSALSMDHPANSNAVLTHPGLVPRLESVLRRHSAAINPDGAVCTKESPALSPNEGHALMAAHVLVHVLAYNAAAAAATAGRPPSAARSGRAGLSAAHAPLCMRLTEAAQVVRVRLPSSSLPSGPGSRDSSRGSGSSGSELLALPAVQMAELLHSIHDVLLPRMRESNVSVACDAVAQLYLLAAGGSTAPATACVRLMAEASLVQQVVTLLSVRDAQLATACLSLLDCMCQDGGCRDLMAEAGWLDRVEQLLDSPDGVVRLLARRALCSVYALEAGRQA